MSLVALLTSGALSIRFFACPSAQRQAERLGRDAGRRVPWGGGGENCRMRTVFLSAPAVSFMGQGPADGGIPGGLPAPHSLVG